MDLNVAEKLRASIKKHEGLKKLAYVDTKNKVTIGYGRNLTDVGLSESECDTLLDHDILTSTYELYRFIPWIQGLDDVRKAVMIELTYNIGIERVLLFRKMLEALKEGNYSLAREELLNSEWATEVGITRSHEMGYSLESGVI